MDHIEAADPNLLGHYEGLVRKTAARYVGLVLHDFEDICQVFRIKVWKALLAWDVTDPRIVKKIEQGDDPDELRDRFVFMCVRNQGKDLVKRRKPEHDPLFIEDIAGGVLDSKERRSTNRDRFEAHYLQVAEDQIFGVINDSDPLIPNTLTAEERRVLVCLYLDLSQPETALRLGFTRKRVSVAVKSIKEKMRDWRPDAQEAASMMPLAEAA